MKKLIFTLIAITTVSFGQTSNFESTKNKVTELVLTGNTKVLKTKIQNKENSKFSKDDSILLKHRYIFNVTVADGVMEQWESTNRTDYTQSLCNAVKDSLIGKINIVSNTFNVLDKKMMHYKYGQYIYLVDSTGKKMAVFIFYNESLEIEYFSVTYAPMY